MLGKPLVKQIILLLLTTEEGPPVEGVPVAAVHVTTAIPLASISVTLGLLLSALPMVLMKFENSLISRLK